MHSDSEIWQLRKTYQVEYHADLHLYLSEIFFTVTTTNQSYNHQQ